IKIESIKQDCESIFQQCNIPYNAQLFEHLIEIRRNSSIHRKYIDYYDEETKQLVTERDRLIIEKFNYSF
ncbi:MAG: hypothetical protein ACC656_11330, partial [Candidatus Heimdallarchaeota archaeon]